MANTATLATNPFLFKNLSYNAEKDFVPVVNVAQTSNILVGGPTLPVSNVQELVAYARANPGKVSYGTFGVGSSSHLDTAALARKADLQLNHVPYKGVADVFPALMGDHVDIALVGVAGAKPFVDDGRLKGLAVFAPEREKALPQVPTLAESGFEGIGAQSWFGFVAPAGVPDAIVQKIAADVRTVLQNEAFVEQYLTRVGLRPMAGTPEDYAATIAKDRAYFEREIPLMNIELN